MFLGQTHHLVEGLPTVVLSGGVAFIVSDMAVGGYKDSDGVRTLHEAVSESTSSNEQPNAPLGAARGAGMRELNSAEAIQRDCIKIARSPRKIVCSKVNLKGVFGLCTT